MTCCQPPFSLLPTMFYTLSKVYQMTRSNSDEPRQGSSVVSVSDSRPGGCEFDPRLRRTFLSCVFSPLTSAEACEKGTRWFWKEKLCSYWCEKARKHICVTDSHDMTLVVKVALTPQNIHPSIRIVMNVKEIENTYIALLYIKNI